MEDLVSVTLMANIHAVPQVAGVVKLINTANVLDALTLGNRQQNQRRLVVFITLL